jgi:endonuclease/exonuclease/phosphatase family metal-dependent hydrolase
MKVTINLLAAIVFFFNISFGQKITVATYNLRFDNRGDTGNLWKDRSLAVIDLIRFHDFEMFGTQEALKNQLDDITSALPAYSRYGAGRDDGKDKGEHAAIFFKKDLFTLVNQGDFWLSETPNTPSMGWDGKCCKRICSWVYLQDKKSKKKFYLFNAHYDHEGMVARVESSKLVLKKIKAIAGTAPVIFSGDLNGNNSSEWYTAIATSGFLKDTYGMVPHPYALSGSFNAFGKMLQQNDIIDHIFVTHQFAVTRWGVLTDSYHGKYPSDHFPVVADVLLK